MDDEDFGMAATTISGIRLADTILSVQFWCKSDAIGDWIRREPQMMQKRSDRWVYFWCLPVNRNFDKCLRERLTDVLLNLKVTRKNAFQLQAVKLIVL